MLFTGSQAGASGFQFLTLLVSLLSCLRVAVCQTKTTTFDSAETQKADGAVLAWNPPNTVWTECYGHPEKTECENLWWNEPLTRTHATMGKGTSCRLTFKGSSIDALGYKYNKGAKLYYSIDGSSEVQVDTYSEDTTLQAMSFFKKDGLDPTKTHEVIIRYDDDSYSSDSSNRKFLYIDYFVYEVPGSDGSSTSSTAIAAAATTTTTNDASPTTSSPTATATASDGSASPAASSSGPSTSPSASAAAAVTVTHSVSGSLVTSVIPASETSSADAVGTTSNSNAGAIAGAAIGSIAVLGLLILALCLFLRRRRRAAIPMVQPYEEKREYYGTSSSNSLAPLRIPTTSVSPPPSGHHIPTFYASEATSPSVESSTGSWVPYSAYSAGTTSMYTSNRSHSRSSAALTESTNPFSPTHEGRYTSMSHSLSNNSMSPTSNIAPPLPPKFHADSGLRFDEEGRPIQPQRMSDVPPSYSPA